MQMRMHVIMRVHMHMRRLRMRMRSWWPGAVAAATPPALQNPSPVAATTRRPLLFRYSTRILRRVQRRHQRKLSAIEREMANTTRLDISVREGMTGRTALRLPLSHLPSSSLLRPLLVRYDPSYPLPSVSRCDSATACLRHSMPPCHSTPPCQVAGKYYPGLVSEIVACLKQSRVEIVEARISSDGATEIGRFICIMTGGSTDREAHETRVMELRESLDQIVSNKGGDAQIAVDQQVDEEEDGVIEVRRCACLRRGLVAVEGMLGNAYSREV